jgi:hypothetical protein
MERQRTPAFYKDLTLIVSGNVCMKSRQYPEARKSLWQHRSWPTSPFQNIPLRLTIDLLQQRWQPNIATWHYCPVM